LKRALAATVATAGGLAALLSYKSGKPPKRLIASAPTASVPSPPSSTPQSTERPTTTSITAPRTTTTTASTAPAAPTVTTRSPGQYADGTFTGSDELNRYGDVQVQAVVRNGRLVDVVPLQLPQDRSRSQQISNYSAPVLHDEAIRAQGAQIDGVSGATYTSIGYLDSLQAALDAARRG
jgi:uncharacterized protein with FMN-binding domain